jgi:hypothetical protein
LVVLGELKLSPTRFATLLKRTKAQSWGFSIDFHNAFNEIKRDHFVRQVSEMFPPMSNWTQWCYGEASMLLYDHEHVIWSRGGVQQGDPLGPLYFCCGINGLVNEIAALNPVYNKWYMDDGGIVGDVSCSRRSGRSSRLEAQLLACI